MAIILNNIANKLLLKFQTSVIAKKTFERTLNPSESESDWGSQHNSKTTFLETQTAHGAVSDRKIANSLSCPKRGHPIANLLIFAKFILLRVKSPSLEND
jgi:hypothetical protein